MATSKKNIREFGKIFQYLKDPELRKKEVGDALLTIEDAEISGESFQYVDWNHILFKNCDFVGAYQIKIGNSTDVRYEDCRFSGIFGYGKTNRVHFLRCAWTDGSIGYAGEKSTALVFESCRFVGTNPDRNHWGGVGSDGEAEFIGCTAKYFVVEGHAKLTLRQCEFEDMKCTPRSKESGGVFADVLIEGCKLRGDFSMVPADFQSLTIRDTLIEGTFNMTSATVNGDILMERVTAGVILGYVKKAKSLTVRDSKITGNGMDVFEAFAGGIRTIAIEGTIFGVGSIRGGNGTDGVTIAGGFSLKDPTRTSNVSQSILIRDSKIPQLQSQHLNTKNLVLRKVEIGEADFTNTRAEVLELDDVSFTKSVNMSGAQIKELKQSGTTDLKRLGRGLKLEGSNIKLPR
ncbi:hypothetical protein GmRootV35_41710 [Variovorax sp. V35]